MATTMPGLFMVEANVGNCGLLACTKKSWANKVRETANGIAKCARNSFAIPLPTGRFMHCVGTVGGGQDVTFPRARVIGSGPSAIDSAKPTAVRVTGFPGIAPSTVDRLTSATIGFDFSNGVTGGSDSAQLIIETNATRFTSGFVSAFNTGSATITGFAPAAPEPRRRGLSGLAWDSWPPSQCDGLTTRNTGVWSTSLACEPQRRTTLGELR
jgi:hypothetical protein